MVSIRDIANKLNLSVSAVSHALNGYADISEETRQRVIAAAEELGYTPNQAARQLRGKRAGVIGYILPASQPRFNDPFFTELIAGLGDESARQQTGVLVSAANPGTEAEQHLYHEWVQAHKVDGFILNRIRLKDWRISYLADHDFPFATLENSLDGMDFPRIEIDNRAGMVRLVAHLAEGGFRRVAYIGGPETLKIQHDRLAGYRQGVSEAGLETESEWIASADLTSAGGYEATRRLLAIPDPPDAIVCVNDETAFGVLHAVHEMGLEVGKDVAVAGFDGVAIAQHTQPPLTTLDQPIYDIGRRLVQMLLAEIAGQPLSERRLLIQPRLIVRASTTGRQA